MSAVATRVMRAAPARPRRRWRVQQQAARRRARRRRRRLEGRARRSRGPPTGRRPTGRRHRVACADRCDQLVAAAGALTWTGAAKRRCLAAVERFEERAYGRRVVLLWVALQVRDEGAA